MSLELHDMLRRYLSLAIPALLTAACGFAYLHFHRAPVAKADPGQLAQAEVPPVGDAPLAPPATPKSAIVPPQKKKAVVRAGQRQPQGEKPKNADEVQTPMLKALLGQIDALTEGTDEEKNSLRDIIYSADLELRDEFGENLVNRIRAANNPKSAFSVKRRTLVPGITQPKPQTKATKPVAPVEVKPIAAKPTSAKVDALDDLFGESK